MSKLRTYKNGIVKTDRNINGKTKDAISFCVNV